ncbi:hypothetical protein P0D88_15700 [Paraburkholderia sp. RL18-103-BIB-C]|jgi:hypothetical protein
MLGGMVLGCFSFAVTLALAVASAVQYGTRATVETRPRVPTEA